MTQATAIVTPPIGLVRDDDLQAHIEDDIRVNAIRGGTPLEVFWNELTEDEKNIARFNLFYNQYYY